MNLVNQPAQLPVTSFAEDVEMEANLRRTLVVLGGAVVLSAGLIYLALGNWILVAVFAAALTGTGALAYLYRAYYPPVAEVEFHTPDWAVTFAACDHPNMAVAITDRAGRLVCANQSFADWFGDGAAPPRLAVEGGGGDLLVEAGRTAWRDGESEVAGIARGGRRYDADLRRVGRGEDFVVWRFAPVVQADVLAETNRLLGGKPGRMLSDAGVLAVVIGKEGRIRAANTGFAMRATGQADANIVGRDFASFLRSDEKNGIYFEREGRKGAPMRLVHIPLSDADEAGAKNGPSLVALIDENGALIDRSSTMAYVETMLSLLPFGLAMLDRDGRFLFVNQAFARASGLEGQPVPTYPADLLVQEDKAAINDAVRRYASGQNQSGNLAVRLKTAADEPVSIGLAGVRGMGAAAVLLSLKDSSEETRLKRQVAQATKMQAVGQLAGGVAHDFNNVLTAILGYCDLMLLRHSPGDSDYDDIQQIKTNSNRAASLTRQLLAFSRQQTLRPQVLQLPDIVSDVTSLLQRLLNEKVKLEVHHDRNLGTVRADKGQIEQVIMNLAVNASDAMPDGGTLTIATRKVTAAMVRAMDSDILPVGEYSAFIVSDTGIGIDPAEMAKIFEPFYTTKEVGKGTGLGLAMVYGIIKQSEGYIFADSTPGKGTEFSIYLPVYEARNAPPPPPRAEPKKPKKESWGSESILLVEDEDMVRAVAERALARQGYKVVTACDGEEGLEKLASEGPFDIVISDVVMPVLDGPAMAHKIRETHPDLPIIFMSGYAEEQLRKSIDVSNMHFLPKPFSVAQIADAVQMALAG